MSSILVVFEWPETTTQQYNQVNNDLKEAGIIPPQGIQHHVTSIKNDGLLIIDIWESKQAFQHFLQALSPILKTHGIITLPPQYYPVHNIINT